MKLRTWGAAALAVCLGAAIAAPTHAREFYAQEEETQQEPSAQPGDMAAAMEQSEFDSYGACETCPSGGWDDYGGGGLLGQLSGGRRVQLIAGAQYIYAQATFSEAPAFLEQDTVNGVDTLHQIDFDYNSSYAFYGGFYLPDCGGAMLFNYTRLTSDGDYAANDTNFTDVIAPFEIFSNIRGRASVDLKSYDLGFSKTIPLGCLLDCGGCGDCGDCCNDGSCGPCGGCGWCPAWDITWSGGVRFADVGWNNTVTQVDPNNNNSFVRSAGTTLDFDGFGGRVGIMGRRYLGKRGLFSLYAKGDLSVLFGDVDLQTAVTNVNGTAFFRSSNDITVPVTEIELGASAHLGQHATVTGGYFWSAWHDLGMSPTYNFDTQVQVGHLDDANILGFNGLFGRFELAF